MNIAKTNFYQSTSDLIKHTIDTAKVFGENQRITNLVTSSIGRFILECNDADAGNALLKYAISCISVQDADCVPSLYSSLNALLDNRV